MLNLFLRLIPVLSREEHPVRSLGKVLVLVLATVLILFLRLAIIRMPLSQFFRKYSVCRSSNYG